MFNDDNFFGFLIPRLVGFFIITFGVIILFDALLYIAINFFQFALSIHGMAITPVLF